MYLLKSTESINIYHKTKIAINEVEHQSLEKLENGLIGSQQQSQCFINTTRGETRRQDAQA